MTSPALCSPIRLRVLVAAVAALTVIAGCETDGNGSQPPPESTTTSSAPTTSTAPTSDMTQPTGGCPERGSMVSDGRLLESERPGADGQTIGGVTWSSTGDCQVVTITFSTADGAPATTPPTLAAHLIRAAGIIRVETEATSSLLSDQRVETGMIGSMYVPTTESETRFVDLTLQAPAVARARMLQSPARLEIELEPGGTPDIGSPLVTESVVVVEPAAGVVDDPVIDISGYAFGPEREVVFEVVANETVLESEELTVGGEAPLWTAFETTIQVGDVGYDGLRISDADGTIAGIPVSRSDPEARRG